VFVRYSLARFLRFWLLRQLYEGQAHMDRLVGALGRPNSSEEREVAGSGEKP
jgi:hypothetical protein